MAKLTLENYERKHWKETPYKMKGDPTSEAERLRREELLDFLVDVDEAHVKHSASPEVTSIITEAEAELGELSKLTVGRQIPHGSASPLRSTNTATGPSFRLGDGRTVQALSHKDRFGSLPYVQDANGYGDHADIGNVVAALATGQTDRLSEAEKLSVIGNSGIAGGYLLNPALSSQVIDLARAASVCMRAGALTIPMETSELSLARITSDATSHWRAEGVTIAASQPVFGRLTLKAKTLACNVPCSIELLEDSPNAGQVITGAIQAAMAAEIDRVILRGTGAASEPCGIRSTTGVNTNTSIGTPGDYSDPTTAVKEILVDNYPGEISALAWLQHPAVAAVYDGLVSATELQPLLGTPWSLALQRMYSTNLPNLEGGGSNEYSDIIGDFTQVVVGMRTSGVVVEVLNSGSAVDADSATVNATSDLMRFIRCYVRLDVGIMQPSWFCVNSGITLT